MKRLIEPILKNHCPINPKDKPQDLTEHFYRTQHTGDANLRYGAHLFFRVAKEALSSLHASKQGCSNTQELSQIKRGIEL